MSPLIHRVADLTNLWESWMDVRARLSEFGQESAQGRRFLDSAADEIEVLHHELLDGTYRPGPLSQVRLSKSGGGHRTLHISTVRDRIVERAVLEVVTPILDPLCSPAAFAYRPGRGVQTAAAEVAALRDERYQWLIQRDIDNCFDTVPRDLAITKMLTALPDSSLDSVVHLLLDRMPTARGLPQGGSLSALLVNLVLRGLDNALCDAGFPLVRYADDFLIFSQTKSDLRTALDIVVDVLDRLGMAVNDDSFNPMNFEEGFTFLGEYFGTTTQTELDDDPPHQRMLYVAQQGCRVRKKKSKIVVEAGKERDVVLEIPQDHISGIACFGSVGVSAGVRSWALHDDKRVVFLSRRGNLLGSLVSGRGHARIEMVRQQLAVADSGCGLALAIACVQAKLNHQVTVLQRFGKRDAVDVVAPAIDSLRLLRVSVQSASTVDEVLGYEGAAARTYFEAYSALLPQDMQFSQRSRRPPKDVVNAALNYGYALLVSEATSALAIAGLDPAVGYLHIDDSQNRPSLALDLMEEFRPYVVDQVVLRAVRRGQLTSNHGKPVEGGVHLSGKGKKVFLEAYERRMLQRTGGALPDMSATIRRLLHIQAQRMAQAIEEENASLYRGLSWR